MIDIDELQHLEICEKCKRVFMPEFKKSMDFSRTPYPVNTDLCSVCLKSKEE